MLSGGASGALRACALVSVSGSASGSVPGSALERVSEKREEEWAWWAMAGQRACVREMCGFSILVGCTE